MPVPAAIRLSDFASYGRRVWKLQRLPIKKRSLSIQVTPMCWLSWDCLTPMRETSPRAMSFSIRPSGCFPCHRSGSRIFATLPKFPRVGTRKRCLHSWLFLKPLHGTRCMRWPVLAILGNVNRRPPARHGFRRTGENGICWKGQRLNLSLIRNPANVLSRVLK